jgi:hypothetical protein
MQNPANLQQAMSLARAYEQRQKEATTVNSSTTPKPSGRHASALASIGTSGATTQDGKMEGLLPHFHHLTAVEMEEKRQNGQCYFCPEPYSKEHNCATKGGVFLMDLADGEEDPLSEINNLEISLHVLTGINSADSMMLQVIVGGVQLRALMDTGSTHMFIHSVFAQHLGLTVTLRAGLNALVANGDWVRSPSIYLATPVTISGEAFSIDCFALDLGSFDLVLGV